MKSDSEKPCLPKMAAISGVMKSATNAAITAVNAAPMTTATARSTTLPRSTNFLKSLEHPAVLSLRPRTRDGIEPEAGIEPATSSLQVKCSTN